MTKSQLIAKLSTKHPNIPRSEVENLVNIILKSLTDSITNKERIELRGFGVFKLKCSPSKTTVNKFTGETFYKPENYIVKFKVSRLLQNKLNQNQHHEK